MRVSPPVQPNYVYRTVSCAPPAQQHHQHRPERTPKHQGARPVCNARGLERVIAANVTTMAAQPGPQRGPALSATTLKFRDDVLEQQFWELPVVKRSLLWTDKWSIVPVVLINLLNGKALPRVAPDAGPLSRTQMLHKFSLVFFCILQLDQFGSIFTNENSYYARRRSWVTFQRVFRSLCVLCFSWVMEYTPGPLPDPESNLTRTILSFVLVGTGALWGCCHAFYFPIDFRTHTRVNAVMLPGQLLLGHKVADLLWHPSVRDRVCHFYRRTFQLGVLWPFAGPTQELFATRLGFHIGHQQLVDTCLTHGPHALTFFSVLFFGFVFPTAACYVWEARLKAAFLRSHEQQRALAEVQAAARARSTGSAPPGLDPLAVLDAQPPPSLYWGLSGYWLWNHYVLALLCYVLFVATGIFTLAALQVTRNLAPPPP